MSACFYLELGMFESKYFRVVSLKKKTQIGRAKSRACELENGEGAA